MTELYPLKQLPLREFHINSVTLYEDQELGSGAYGKVCKAKYGDLPCAAKLLHPVLFRYSTGNHSVTVRKFEQECQLLSIVKHPCIVQYLATYIHPESGQPVLLMEFIDESLTHFLETATKPIPLHIQTNIIHNITLALAYLHSNEIIHRDLTGNNVLVVAGKYAKVTDFGMLKFVDSQIESGNPRLRQMTLCPGCPAYMPPEALKVPPHYTKKLDIFSLGVIVVQILTRKFPKPRDANRGESEIDRRRSHISTIASDHPLLPVGFQCLRNKDKERPNAGEICRELACIKDTPSYLESVHSDTTSPTSSMEQLTQELQAAREEVSRLSSQLESLKTENRQLYRVIEGARDGSTSPRKPYHNGSIRNGAAVLARTPSNECSLEDSMRRLQLDIDYDSFSDEDLDLEIATCPPAMWYHGRIDRDVASKRLHSVGRPGAYLVRNSESTPGSFVLTFLDKERRAFNYMINHKDGKYNASGQSKRWFPSLQHLIRYYTKFSTVKQNQHLELPIAPPEVVPLPTD